jgi:hypothetical protein
LCSVFCLKLLPKSIRASPCTPRPSCQLPHPTFRITRSVKLIRGSNDLGIHRSTTPLQSNVSASQFILQVLCLPLRTFGLRFSHFSAHQAAKGAPNNSPTEPYNPAAYQSSMPSQFGTAFVPHHSQASMQPIGDTDRTRQILEVPFSHNHFHLRVAASLATDTVKPQLLVHSTLFTTQRFCCRIAVASGIWNEGDICSDCVTFDVALSFVQAPLSAFFWSSVTHDAKNRYSLAFFHVYLIRLFVTNAAVQQTGVGTVSGCCPRGDCKTQEHVRFLINPILLSFSYHSL